MRNLNDPFYSNLKNATSPLNVTSVLVVLEQQNNPTKRL